MCPDARTSERQHLLDRLNILPGHSLCDIPAGGGYVADGIEPALYDSLNLICIEPSFIFAKGLNERYPSIVGTFNKTPLADSSIDRVSSLAGIHHLLNKQTFFNEVARVLKQQGTFAVADVQVDTAPALFLNDAVDRLTETGHEGEFLEPGELTQRLGNAGFVGITEELINFTWDFPDEETLVRFCHQLFCMSKATHEQVKQEIESALTIISNRGGAKLEWSLVYASGHI